jgi:alkylated DNA nucleotide flippase Atl1
MMAQTFDDAVGEAVTGERAALRALQIWQILISRASSSSMITYGELAEILGYGGAGVFAGILGHILHYCQQNELPPLTSIVVNQETGLPGEGFGMRPGRIPPRHMEVFNYNWFGLVPPTMDELKEAFAEG